MIFWKCTPNTKIGGTIFNIINRSIYKLIGLKRSPAADTTINEVLIYGTPDKKDEMIRTGMNNLACVYYVMVHAARSIDICMPSFLSDTLIKCLLEIKRTSPSVKIRLSIHSSSDTSGISVLAGFNVQVKAITSHINLEHEFILVDACDEMEEAVVIMGSLDYEFTDVNCHRDNTIITSELCVVTPLKMEFERVWDSTAELIILENDQNNS